MRVVQHFKTDTKKQTPRPFRAEQWQCGLRSTYGSTVDSTGRRSQRVSRLIGTPAPLHKELARCPNDVVVNGSTSLMLHNITEKFVPLAHKAP